MSCNGCLFEDDCEGQFNNQDDKSEGLKEEMRILATREIAYNQIPQYSFSTAKQLIFDCIMELDYEYEKLSNKQISAKLQGILKELDKMNKLE